MSGNAVEVIPFDPSLRVPLAASEQSGALIWYESKSGVFSSGLWQSTPCANPVNYTEDEFCYIIEGKVRIKSKSGIVQEFSAGDSFVIPSGFSGTWESLTEVRKFWVIYEQK